MVFICDLGDHYWVRSLRQQPRRAPMVQLQLPLRERRREHGAGERAPHRAGASRGPPDARRDAGGKAEEARCTAEASGLHSLSSRACGVESKSATSKLQKGALG